jgi:hypothetical protein
VSNQTVSDDQVLEQLEAEFLRSASSLASCPEFDLAEMLAPAVGLLDDEAARMMSKKTSRKYCCDY